MSSEQLGSADGGETEAVEVTGGAAVVDIAAEDPASVARVLPIGGGGGWMRPLEEAPRLEPACSPSLQ